MPKLLLTLFLCAILSDASAQAKELSMQKAPETFGFSSPQEALQILRSRPNIVYRQSQGWIIAIDASSRTTWSFPRKGSPAFPSVIQEVVIPFGDEFRVEMRVLCGGPQSACDQMLLDYKRLSNQDKIIEK